MNRIRSSFRNALRHFVVLAAGLMLVGVPSMAFADDDPFDRSGPYVGLSGVYQTNVFEDRVDDLVSDVLENELGAGVNVKVSIEDSGGLNALVGYRLLSFLAAELQYEWIGRYDVGANIDGLPGVSGNFYSISGHTLTANGKMIVPFWRVQPYLVIGVGFSTFDVDRGALFNDPTVGPALAAAGIRVKQGKHTDLAGRAGLGLDVYLTENIVLNGQGQVVLTTLKKPSLDDIDSLNYVGFSAGLQYRF